MIPEVLRSLITGAETLLSRPVGQGILMAQGERKSRFYDAPPNNMGAPKPDMGAPIKPARPARRGQK